MRRKNWIPEVATLTLLAVVAGYIGFAASNYYYMNRNAIESTRDGGAACVSSSKETTDELSNTVERSREEDKDRKLPSIAPAVPQPEKAVPAPTKPEPTDEDETTTEGYAERMVNALNKVRRDHLVGPVTWSNDLSEAAGAWGLELIESGCALKHDPKTRHGENLAKGYRTPEAAVAAWAGEEKYYNYSSNTCADGKVCGHYTQIVWADTTEVGCQQYDCHDGHPVLVCRFSPAGNFIGQKPY